MKIQYEQLTNHLRRLAPAYLIAGEEILLIQEARQAIRDAAAKKGFTERVSFTVDNQFDWQAFQQNLQNRSLFSEQQLLELDLSAGKLNDAGKTILLNYFQHSYPDKLLIIRTGKLDANLQKNAWYKIVEKQGVVVPIWPIAPAQLPAWLQRRLQNVGLQADAESLELLAIRTQGNLLAAAQEIEKLSLLYPHGRLTIQQIEQSSSNNARYDVFNLTDAILTAEPNGVLRVLQGLQEEGAEPTLILWALAREARQWLQWLIAQQQGYALSQIISGNFALEKKKNSIARALQRHTVASLQHHLQQAAQIDRCIKGAEPGNVWQLFKDLALGMTGVRVV
jgi:DNA polymerase-3 subunit delta